MFPNCICREMVRRPRAGAEGVKNTEEKFPHYWICDACAKERGGVWPEGLCATLLQTACKYCRGEKQKEEFIAPYVDYDWPADPVLTRRARMQRD